MPKAKRREAEGHSPPKPNLGFLANHWLWRVILVFVIVGLLFLFTPILITWGAMVFTLFGLGLVMLIAAAVMAIWLMRGEHRDWLKKHWDTFTRRVRYWNLVVGGLVLFVAVWGLLSFFRPGAFQEATLGGKIGQWIAGSQNFIGGLRIAGLFLLGIIFLAPRRAWQVVAVVVRAYRIALRRRPPVVVAPVVPAETTPGEPAPAPSGQAAVAEVKQLMAEREPVVTPGGWRLPPIDILDKPVEVELNPEEVTKRAKLIEEALASYGVEAKVVQTNIGPTVTQFGVEPGWDRKYKDGEEISRTRVRVERITSLANDLALALAAPSVRIEAPVPGKSMVGVEVPNTVFGAVSLRSVIETAAFQKVKAKSKLAVALGKGAGGEAIVADLAKMPHLLIAGATGSGKTVCLDSCICCLLLYNSPDDVRFIMVDPKRVELVVFNGMPNLVAPVIVDTSAALTALRWLNQEMDQRYRQFAQAGVRNIEGYNEACLKSAAGEAKPARDRFGEEPLPYLVLVIDELADLMMAAFDEVERGLCRLAQLARATGIHLIVATQRPSVDVITGLIKANFPTRVSFAVTSQVDSRTILDMVGAEKLLGRGDMLYMPTEAGKPKRLQGTFVSDSEMEKLVYFWGSQSRPGVSQVNFAEMGELPPPGQKAVGGEDPLLEEARRLAAAHEQLSASFLQRRLRIGYPRAARLMDILEQEGTVPPTPPPREEG